MKDISARLQTMIDVLLASYKPKAEHLAAQIESIRVQKDVEVNLIAS